MPSYEELIGISEAYKIYLICSEELKEKIPNDFVEYLKKYYNSSLSKNITSLDDINEELSDEGLSLIKYMTQFI